MSQGVPKRVFPPLYHATNNAGVDQLAFFHILENLKENSEENRVDLSSNHMYRMALLSLCSSDEELDVAKCVMLSVVHDLAEAQVGDIAPREGIPNSEKRRLEEGAMENFVHEMLHNSPAAQRIETLWNEYEAQETKEARFVKGEDLARRTECSIEVYMTDLDRFEMVLQASEYERRDGTDTLQSFFDNSLPLIKHPEVKSWADNLESERLQRAKKP